MQFRKATFAENYYLTRRDTSFCTFRFYTDLAQIPRAGWIIYVWCMGYAVSHMVSQLLFSSKRGHLCNECHPILTYACSACILVLTSKKSCSLPVLKYSRTKFHHMYILTFLHFWKQYWQDSWTLRFRLTQFFKAVHFEDKFLVL